MTDINLGLHFLHADGIKYHLFKGYDRWVSESAKDGYIKDNLVHGRIANCLYL